MKKRQNQDLENESSKLIEDSLKDRLFEMFNTDSLSATIFSAAIMANKHLLPKDSLRDILKNFPQILAVCQKIDILCESESDIEAEMLPSFLDGANLGFESALTALEFIYCKFLAKEVTRIRAKYSSKEDLSESI